MSLLRPPRRSTRAALAAAVAVTLAGGVLATGSASATVPPTSITASMVSVVSGLTSPTGVTSARDGLGRLFVVEQGGLVRLVANGAIASTPYLDLRSKVATSGEQGLLSIAFHPGFKSRPYVYAAYARKSDGALVISRFTAKSYAASTVSAATERVALVIPHPSQTNHYGGQLQFGPDLYLYIGTGDGGGAGDPYRNAEKLSVLLAKILRINVDSSCSGRYYCIPAANPFANSASGSVRKEIFDYGVRNPWRFSFDRSDKTLWIGDVGQGAEEEIDHATTKGGLDFGWSCKEGYGTYNSSNCTINGQPRRITHPALSYGHNNNNCAVIGGYVYRGPSYPFANGHYVFTDYCSASLWLFGPNGDGTYSRPLVGAVPGNPTGFGEADNGELYVVSQDGHLYHVTFTQH